MYNKCYILLIIFNIIPYNVVYLNQSHCLNIGIACFAEDKVLCDNSNCIFDYWVCDIKTPSDEPDCIDGTDEPAPGCCNPYTHFMCSNVSRCIGKDKRCDGTVGDCSADDTSDEDNCPGEIE